MGLESCVKFWSRYLKPLFAFSLTELETSRHSPSISHFYWWAAEKCFCVLLVSWLKSWLVLLLLRHAENIFTIQWHLGSSKIIYHTTLVKRLHEFSMLIVSSSPARQFWHHYKNLLSFCAPSRLCFPPIRVFIEGAAFLWWSVAEWRIRLFPQGYRVWFHIPFPSTVISVAHFLSPPILLNENIRCQL